MTTHSPSEPGRVQSFWLGGHKAGKTATQKAEVDAAVGLGEHVHTYGEEGARCFNGTCDLAVPLQGRTHRR